MGDCGAQILYLGVDALERAKIGLAPDFRVYNSCHFECAPVAIFGRMVPSLRRGGAKIKYA